MKATLISAVCFAACLAVGFADPPTWLGGLAIVVGHGCIPMFFFNASTLPSRLRVSRHS